MKVSKTYSVSNQAHSPTMKHSTLSASKPLTNSEIEQLKQRTKEKTALLQRKYPSLKVVPMG